MQIVIASLVALSSGCEALRSDHPFEDLQRQRSASDTRTRLEHTQQWVHHLEICADATARALAFKDPSQPSQGLLAPGSLDDQRRALAICENEQHALSHTQSRSESGSSASLAAAMQPVLDALQTLVTVRSELDADAISDTGHRNDAAILQTATTMRSRTAFDAANAAYRRLETELDEIHRQNDPPLENLLAGRDPNWRAAGIALGLRIRTLRRCIERALWSADARPRAACDARLVKARQSLYAVADSLISAPGANVFGLAELESCARRCVEATENEIPKLSSARLRRTELLELRDDCHRCESAAKRVQWDP